MIISNAQAVSGNSFIKNELHIPFSYLNWQWVKCFLITASSNGGQFEEVNLSNDAERMEKFPSFSFPFSTISGCNQCFSFPVPSEQLYIDTFPLVFLKFLSLLLDTPDPLQIKSSLNDRKLLEILFSQRT